MRTSSARHAQRLEVQLQTDGANPLFSRGTSGSNVKNTNTITIFRQPSQGTFVARTPIVSTTPFDSIESSHEYVALLADIIEESRRDVEAEIALAKGEHADRRQEALRLVSYNLAKLSMHMTASRRILNDLRTLRRLLLGERGAEVAGRERPAVQLFSA